MYPFKNWNVLEHSRTNVNPVKGDISDSELNAGCPILTGPHVAESYFEIYKSSEILRFNIF